MAAAELPTLQTPHTSGDGSYLLAYRSQSFPHPVLKPSEDNSSIELLINTPCAIWKEALTVNILKIPFMPKDT